MPYEVLQHDVQVLKDLAEVLNEDGEVVGHDHESVIYLKGQVVADEDVAQVVKDAYDSGDEHIKSLLRKVSAAEAKKLAPDASEETDDDSDQEPEAAKK